MVLPFSQQQMRGRDCKTDPGPRQQRGMALTNKRQHTATRSHSPAHVIHGGRGQHSMSSIALQLSKCVNRVAVVRMFCMSFTDTFVYTFLHCVCVRAELDKKCSVSILFFLQAGYLHLEGHRQVAGRISNLTSVACKACVSVLPSTSCCWIHYSSLHDHECLKGSGTMIATGVETFLYSTVTVKLYYKPASYLIITVSINMAVRMLPHSTTGNVSVLLSCRQSHIGKQPWPCLAVTLPTVANFRQSHLENGKVPAELDPRNFSEP